MNETNSTNGDNSAAIGSHIYAVQGLIVVITSGLVFLTILRHEVLRSKKEYIIVAALSFADLYNAMGYATAGIYRSWVVLSGRSEILVSAWFCATIPHNIFFTIGEMLSCGMLCCISLDRLICMCNPLGYFGYSTTYSFCLISPFFVYSFIFGISNAVGVYILNDVTKRFSSICWMRSAFVSQFWHQVQLTSVLIFAYCSVLIYIPVFVIYKKRQSATGPTILTTAKSREQKKQDRFMKTVALSTLCNFVFWILGYHAFFYSYTFDITKYTVVAWMLIDIWKNLNPFINIFLFSFRHKDIKLGIKYLFKGKTLTEAAIKKVEQEERNKKGATQNTKAVDKNLDKKTYHYSKNIGDPSRPKVHGGAPYKGFNKNLVVV